MALGAEVTVSIVFGILMAVIALLAIWQVAHYAARGFLGTWHMIMRGLLLIGCSSKFPVEQFRTRSIATPNTHCIMGAFCLPVSA
jgi:hypothetical protein